MGENFEGAVLNRDGVVKVKVWVFKSSNEIGRCLFECG